MNERIIDKIRRGVRVVAVAATIGAGGTACGDFKPVLTVRVEDCEKSKVQIYGPGWVDVSNPDGTRYQVQEPSRDLKITTRLGKPCRTVKTY